MKMRLSKWIYDTLGPEWGGTPSPPGSECELDFGELDGNTKDPESMKPMYVARTYADDGANLWLGTHSKWHVFYRAQDARKLAWFILWEWWAVSTWFGLKRKIWYWALHNIVESYRPNTASSRPAVGGDESDGSNTAGG